MTETKAIYQSTLDAELVAKEAGMSLAASHDADWLDAAQRAAVALAQGGRVITIDDVIRTVGKPVVSNAAGSVFRGPQWEQMGWRKSERVGNHGRQVICWRLRRA